MKSKFVAPLSLAGSVAALFLFQVDFVSSQQSFGADSQFRASDPSVRGGAAGAGGQIDGLSFNQQAFFASGLADFNSAEEVDAGLGPRMNPDGCGGCGHPSARGTRLTSLDVLLAPSSKQWGKKRHPPLYSLH